MEATRDKTDEIWDYIQLQYRTGDYSWRALASLARDKFGSGPTHQGIHARAGRENWVQDLRSEVRAQTERELARQPSETVELLDGDRQAVQVAAAVQAVVIRKHRADMVRLRTLAEEMLDATERECRHMIKQVGTGVFSDQSGKITAVQGMYMRALAINKELHSAERRAFGIDDADAVPAVSAGEVPDSLEDALDDLAERLALEAPGEGGEGADDGADLVPGVLREDVPVRIDPRVADEGDDPADGEADD